MAMKGYFTFPEAPGPSDSLVLYPRHSSGGGGGGGGGVVGVFYCLSQLGGN